VLGGGRLSVCQGSPVVRVCHRARLHDRDDLGLGDGAEDLAAEWDEAGLVL
jgi:hypothetical protein